MSRRAEYHKNVYNHKSIDEHRYSLWIDNPTMERLRHAAKAEGHQHPSPIIRRAIHAWLKAYYGPNQ